MTKKKDKSEKVEIVEKFDFELYSDVVRVIHNPRTFAIDFGQIVPWHKRELIYKVRVFMSPEHFASFVDLLKGNLETYQKTFGKVERRE